MKKIERKDFLKLCGGVVAGGLSGYVFSGAPFRGLEWLVEWTQNQYEPAGGREEYLKSVCTACRAKCEMSIRIIGDRAVQIETSNIGCPFGRNALQLLYHPERIDAPLKRIGGKGTVDPSSFIKVGWDEALKDIASRMNEMISNRKGHLIAGISKADNLSAMLLDRLIKVAGSGNIYYEPSFDTLTGAVLGGHIEYDFNNSDYILSFGARLLEGWGDPGTLSNAFIEWKKNGAAFVQADAVCTRTASMADEWLNIKPGTELFLAIGMAGYMAGKKGKIIGGTDWSDLYKEYTIERASKITGLTIRQIEDVSKAFSHAGNPIAVAGRGGRGVSSSSAEIMAVYALNSMLGSRAVSLKKTRGLGEPSLSADAWSSLKEAKRFAGIDDFIKNGKFEMIFINESDPVYKSVFGNDLAEKMRDAFVVAVMPLLNDTAMFADYIFPSVIFLEEETKGAGGPIAPYKKIRHAGDTIIALANMVDSKDNFPWTSYIELVRTYEDFVKTDKINLDAKIVKDQLASLEKRTMASDDFPLNMLPVELPFVGDGDGLAFPYVLKTINGKTFSKGKLWVEINRSTAGKYGLSEGSSIKIESNRGRIAGVRVHLTDIVPPGTIAFPLGFGHKAYTKYARDKGINPKKIMAAEIDPVTGVADWWLTRVKVSVL